jgi:hypothetical protein
MGWWCEVPKTWHSIFHTLDQQLGALENKVRGILAPPVTHADATTPESGRTQSWPG